MNSDRSTRQNLASSRDLRNFDLTRKQFAVRTMEVVQTLLDREARQQTPNGATAAALAAAMAQLLAAVT